MRPVSLPSRPASPDRARWLVGLPALSLVGAAIAVLPWGEGDSQGVLLAALILLCFALVAVMGELTTTAIGRIVLMAFLVRTLTALVFRLYPILPPLYTLDAETYSKESWLIAKAWRAGTDYVVDYMSPNVTVHEHATAALYFVIGESGLGSRILSALLGALAVLFVYRLANVLVGRRRAVLVALVVAVLPSHIFWTSHTWRDPWVFFLSALALHRFVLWLRDGRKGDWVTAVAAALGAGLFRLTTGFLLGVTLLAISLWHARLRLHWTLRVPWLVLCTVVVGGLSFAWRDAFPLDQLSPARLSFIRQGLATGGTALFPDLQFRSWSDILAFVPIGATYFLFGPFPWQARGALDTLAAAENLVLYAAVALACFRPSALGVLCRRETAPLLLFVGLGAGTLGVLEGNLGTAYRHKMQFLPYVLVLSAPAWPALGDVRIRSARIAEDERDRRQ